MMGINSLAACICGGALLVYRVTSVRAVRFERLRQLEKRFSHLVDDATAMTYLEAEEIMRLCHSFDMPWLTAFALSFALFKTYAVPTISSVLCKSGELAYSIHSAARRAEDTGIFVTEFLYPGLDTERGSIAVARTNYLHGRYGSLISQDDLKFTLSLFIFEPMGWLERFEWRALTEMEKEARYVFWREVGARMGMQDIPRTRQDFVVWKERYADKAMRYAPSNETVGDATFGVFLAPLPAFLRPFAKTAATTLIDDRTRRAFGWPRPPNWMYVVVPTLLRMKGLFCGWILYPRTTRPGYLRAEPHINEQGKTTLRRQGFLFQPYYVPPACSAMGAFGYGKPGVEGLHSNGFTSETLGPEKMRDSGVEKCLKDAEVIRAQAAVCPYFQ